MVESIEKYFPKDVAYTTPEGGMFIGVTLPEGMSSTKLFDIAIAKNVAFVPGVPFYIGADDANTLRLNYNNSDNDKITEGIKRMGEEKAELGKFFLYLLMQTYPAIYL